jgi:hypothetical protein
MYSSHRIAGVLALELAVNSSPIGLGASATASLSADRSEECRLQRGVGHLNRQWLVEPGIGQSF